MRKIDENNDVIIPQSALTLKERAIYGGLSPKKQKEFLEKEFGAERIVELPGGKLGVTHEKDQSVIYPVDVDASEVSDVGGDIAEAVPHVLKGIAQAIGGTAGGVLGSMATPVAGTVGGAVAGSAAGSALADAVLQKIASKAAGIDEKIDTGQVLQEGALGALTSVPVFGFAKGLIKGAPLKSMVSEVVEQLPEKTVASSKILKEFIPEKIETEIPIKKLISGDIGYQTVENIFENEYVRKNIKPFITKNVDTLAKQAKDSVKDLHDDFPRLQSLAYKRAGVDYDTKVSLKEAIPQMKATIKNLSSEVVTENDQKAIKALKRIMNQVNRGTNNKGEMKFGKLTSITKKINDIIEANRTDTGSLNEIGRAMSSFQAMLTKAKNDIPQIKKASSKFRTYREIDEEIRDLFTNLDRTSGEISFEKKILRRSVDKGNQEFFERLKALNEKIKSVPELKKHREAIDKVMLTHVANNLAKSKEIPKTGFAGTIPGIGKMLSETLNMMGAEEKAMNLARLASVKPKNFIEKKIGVSGIPILGKKLAHAEAIGHLYAPRATEALKNVVSIINRIERTASKAIIPVITKDAIRKMKNETLSQINRSNYERQIIDDNGNVDKNSVEMIRLERGLA